MTQKTPSFGGFLGKCFGRASWLAMGLVCMASLALGGCPRPEFPQLIDGLTLDHLREIRDSDMTRQEQEQALRDLGVEDQQLINVLLTVPLPAADT